MPHSSRLLVAIVALLLPMLLGAPLSAQLHDNPRPPIRYASPFLDPEHWAVRAAKRLHAVGLAPQTYDPAVRSQRLIEVAAVFIHAAYIWPSDRIRDLLQGYTDRLREEFGPSHVDASGISAYGPTFVRVGAGAGMVHHGGRVLTGIGYSNVDDWTGTDPLEDVTSPAVNASLHGALSRRVAFGARAAAHLDGITIDDAYLVGHAGFFGFWAGRRALGFGPGWSGSIALDDQRSFTGAGMYFTDGYTLPSILRYLGPIRFEGFLTRVENEDRPTDPKDPLFGSARLSSNLHNRFALAATRAVMFGGANNTDFELKYLLQMLYGDHAGIAGEWSNEVFAWDMRFRPPLGSLPLLLFFEMGMDDSAGAIYRAPAWVLGADVGQIPGAPEFGFGLERIYIPAASIKNTIWYRNWSLRGGWTDDRRLLGHPLGGHGKGWLAHAHADLDDARLSVNASVFRFDRGAENLFAPERVGRAYGAEIDAAYRFAPSLEFRARGRIEDGSDWRQSSAEVGVRWTDR